MIRANERVRAVNAKAITLSSGESLSSDVTVWTTGFENVAACYLPDTMCTNGRLSVNEQLTHPKHKTLYAVGDIAYAVDPVSGQPYPQLGETAASQGRFVAKDILNQIKKRPRATFSFQSIGNLIPLGDWDGAAMIGKLTFFGIFARLTRHMVYIAVIPTWKAKFKIMIDWALHSFGPRYILGASQESSSTLDAK